MKKNTVQVKDARALAQEAASVLSEVKGKDITLLKLSEVSSFADYFVVVTGDTHVHMKALADRVRERMSKCGISIGRAEGRESKTWILLDYHDIIIHIFSPKAREFYALDQLWGDAHEIPFDETAYENEPVREQGNGTWH